jgi:hypothetical protein
MPAMAAASRRDATRFRASSGRIERRIIGAPRINVVQSKS